MAKTEKTPKITKAMKFEDAIALLNGETPKNGCSIDVVVEALNHEIELLAKKNSADRKPTAAQQANAGIKTVIVEYLNANPNLMATATDLMKNVPELGELSNQKITSLLTQLHEGGQIVRTYEKRKAYFSALLSK